MSRKKDDYTYFQDLIFQEMQNLSDLQAQSDEEFTVIGLRYGKLCGLTEEAARPASQIRELLTSFGQH